MKKKPSRNTIAARKKRYRNTLIILLAAILTLIIFLLILPNPEGKKTDTTKAPKKQVEKEPLQKEEPSKHKEDRISFVDKKSSPTPKKSIIKKKTGHICVVLDDVGQNNYNYKPFLEIGIPLTFAVLPELPYSLTAVREIKQAGFNVILHQPMQSLGGNNPGPGALYLNMEKTEIHKILDRHFSAYPFIRGMNNHMGSAVTADSQAMDSIFEYLASRKFFFLDSRTNSQSVAAEAAQKWNVPLVERSHFLDNKRDRESIRAALLQAAKDAQGAPYALCIGHVTSPETAFVLEKESINLRKKGIIFVTLKEIF